MIWPVPLRGSMRSTATASSSDATSLSMPNNAMWTGGSVVVRSALTSLVTSTMVPVSAMAMFAPEMPTVASMNFLRSDARAWLWIASTVGSVPNTRAASSLVRWMAGAMMWEGCVWVSCTMRSPRSVSTTSIPSDSRYGLSSISSLAIDLTLVTTGWRWPPAVFQQIRPMMSRAAAASLAKWTFPPTASSRSVNCSINSGKRVRFAWRRALRSARPVSKSKLLKPASRRARRPIIACVSAFCSLGSSSALLTRREKWRLDSGTRLACFLNCLADRGWCRHRGQAYGPDAHDGSIILVGVDDGVWMHEHSGSRQRWVPGADFDAVIQPVQGTREDRRHQAVLAREGGDRLEDAARASQVRLRGITHQLVELRQRNRCDRVLDQGLDGLAQAAELVSAGVVEITA